MFNDISLRDKFVPTYLITNNMLVLFKQKFPKLLIKSVTLCDYIELFLTVLLTLERSIH